MESLSETPIRSLVDEFNPQEEIYMKDQELVKQILSQMKNDGPLHLDLLTDFDHTLTANSHGGNRGDSSFTVLGKSKLMSEQFNQDLTDLYEKYAPYEKDLSLSEEERGFYMDTWWNKTHERIIQEKISRGQIKNCIIESNMYFRDGFMDLLGICNCNKIPIYIVSAGFGSTIVESFKLVEQHFEIKQPKRWYQQLGKNTIKLLTILSNNEIFDQNETIIGFKQPIVTTMNKSSIISSKDNPNLRKNAIVMGDIIDDLKMLHNVNYSNVLKIGFCNSPNHGGVSLDDYINNFDIVIANDGSLVHIAELIRNITGEEEEIEGYDSLKNSDKIKLLIS